MRKPTIKMNRTFKTGALVIYDILAIVVSCLLALYVRFDYSTIPSQYVSGCMDYMIIHIMLSMLVFAALRLYERIWRFASLVEFFTIIIGTFLTGVELFLGLKVLNIEMPESFAMLYFIFATILIGGGRFTYRLIYVLRNRFLSQKNEKLVNTLVIGAGVAGSTLIKEIKDSEFLNYHLCCVIDNNPAKKGTFVNGIKVIGGNESIIPAVEKYKIQEIIIAISVLSRTDKTQLLNICKETGCEVKLLPGVCEMLKGEVVTSQLRNVEIDDLLGRDPIRIDTVEVGSYTAGKTVLITGGGGSIGSELCRQLAANHVERLIIFDIYENNVYDIQQELKEKYPDLDLVVIIGSVRDTKRVENVFEEYSPQIVYHAAAHKHVPLMEDSPNEAIKNNVFGTYAVAHAADQYEVEKFVLISTDKAVNPTNIMGASKRMCEMIVQMFNNHSNTDFVAVRFGNVLGSNGSVIPLFKKQIQAGGPVTVTHPEIIRYFMTITEAVSLVLQAGGQAKGGEIFVLDMGEPVKIDDLARNLIRLSGYKVDEDIKIVYTGLRPGEKLYEELLMSEEGLKNTDNKLIHIGQPIEFDEKEYLAQLDELHRAVYIESINTKQMVKSIVDTYQIREEDIIRDKAKLKEEIQRVNKVKSMLPMDFMERNEKKERIG